MFSPMLMELTLERSTWELVYALSSDRAEVELRGGEGGEEEDMNLDLQVVHVVYSTVHVHTCSACVVCITCVLYIQVAHMIEAKELTVFCFFCTQGLSEQQIVDSYLNSDQTVRQAKVISLFCLLSLPPTGGGLEFPP